MGRRKIPQTREKCQSELEYCKNEMRKCDNTIKLEENSQSKQARNERTRRLCREAGELEHYVPELQDMDEKTAGEFIKVITTDEAAVRFLNEKGFRES